MYSRMQLLQYNYCTTCAVAILLNLAHFKSTTTIAKFLSFWIKNSINLSQEQCLKQSESFTLITVALLRGSVNK